VTNEYMSSNLLKNLNNNKEDLNEYNNQLSTGKKFDSPSDDPTGVAKSMDLDVTIEQNEQQTSNVEEGLAWSKATDSAMEQAGNSLQRARELAVKGAGGSLNTEDRNALAAEIDQLRENVVDVANSKHNDRYLFAGQKTKIKPYADIDGGYQGDQGEIKREIASGTELKINTTGEFFSSALDNLKKLSDDLKAGRTGEISNQRLGELDENINTLLEKRAENGARQKRMEMTKNRLEEDKIKFEKLLSENEDVDMAKTIMDLKMSENVYRAALSSGSRIIQPSLVDFIK
ncbi:MAG: flagellar hook-associated protein FlgL, partial [Bacillota bacterium]